MYRNWQLDEGGDIDTASTCKHNHQQQKKKRITSANNVSRPMRLWKRVYVCCGYVRIYECVCVSFRLAAQTQTTYFLVLSGRLGITVIIFLFNYKLNINRRKM